MCRHPLLPSSGGLSEAQPVQRVLGLKETSRALQKTSPRTSLRTAQMLRRKRNRRSMTVKRQVLMSLDPIQKNSRPQKGPHSWPQIHWPARLQESVNARHTFSCTCWYCSGMHMRDSKGHQWSFSARVSQRIAMWWSTPLYSALFASSIKQVSIKLIGEACRLICQDACLLKVASIVALHVL